MHSPPAWAHKFFPCSVTHSPTSEDDDGNERENLLPQEVLLLGGEQVATVSISTALKISGFGHVPPKLETVLRRVMYVPPIRGSAI